MSGGCNVSMTDNQFGVQGGRNAALRRNSRVVDKWNWFCRAHGMQLAFDHARRQRFNGKWTNLRSVGAASHGSDTMTAVSRAFVISYRCRLSELGTRTSDMNLRVA